MRLLDVGLLEYGACLELQHRLRDRRIRGEGEDTLVVVEHPPVATLGRRGSADEVFDRTLPVFSIERGGKATLHAPGQLVLYPVAHLGEGNRDVRAWVQHLEGLVIRLLGDFGIPAHVEVERPGVWTDGGRKIASLGIAISHWVSTHGIALNVTLDPREFERIDPCGLGAAVMTSMARERPEAGITMEGVRAWVRQHAVAHIEPFLAGRKPVAA